MMRPDFCGGKRPNTSGSNINFPLSCRTNLRLDFLDGTVADLQRADGPLREAVKHRLRAVAHVQTLDRGRAEFLKVFFSDIFVKRKPNSHFLISKDMYFETFLLKYSSIICDWLSVGVRSK